MLQGDLDGMKQTASPITGENVFVDEVSMTNAKNMLERSFPEPRQCQALSWPQSAIWFCNDEIADNLSQLILL